MAELGRRSHEVSVRDLSGIGVTEDPELLSLPVTGSRRLVILIHGFATNVEKANKSYGRFVRNLISATSGRGPSSTEYVCFHWPGDHSWAGVNQATYGARRDAARLSGEILADLIADAVCDEVVIVAHSLGSRVALSALRKLKKRRQSDATPRLSVAILMAAAVPVEDCDHDGSFSRTKTEGERQVVLYSQQDAVLGVLFSPGEFSYSKSWRRAVGRFGEPDARWDRAESMYFGHGGYWKGRRSAEVVAQELHASSDFTLTGLRLPSATLPATQLQTT